MKYVGLLDCNNFFVSCERIFRPDLNNKPVVVLSSNDGCVVARSQEIKDINIPMGVPYFQIKDKLEEVKAEIFSSNFTLYRDISRRVFEVARETLDTMEQYSIDECFFVVDSSDVEIVAEKLRSQIKQKVGIPVSIGLASSKTQAKYASTIAKRTNGVAVLSDGSWKQLRSNIFLTEIWGVGSGRSRQFNKHGIKTVGEYLALSPAIVQTLFGVEGYRLWTELSGVCVYPVAFATKNQQTITSTRSFASATDNVMILQDALAHHLHSAVADLQRMNLEASVLRIMIYPSQYGDFALQGTSVQATSEVPTSSLFTWEKIMVDLLNKAYVKGVPYKKAGVLLTGLTPEVVSTGSLFSIQSISQTKPLEDAIKNLNQRYSRNIIQLGRASKKSTVWLPRRSNVSPDYTTSWQELKSVLAV